MAWLLGDLKGLHTIRIVFERAWGLCVTWFTFWLPESTMTFFGRVVSQMRMVFPLSLWCWRISSFRSLFCGRQCRDGHTYTFQKWVFYQRIFGLFCGASEPLFIMCGRFVGYLCTVAEGQCLRHYVVLFLCGLRKLLFLMKYDCHSKYVLVNVRHVAVNL